MALPICELCGEKEAAQLMTNFETGGSLAICADDYPTFILGLAEQMMENGLIELPEIPQPESTATDHDAIESARDYEVNPNGSQEPLGAVNTADGAKVAPKAKRAPRTTTAAPGPSPEDITEAPTATVDVETAETAESPASAIAN